jgi:class 3 adenylate cyclase
VDSAVEQPPPSPPGARLAEACRVCASPLPPEARFCAVCGARRITAGATEERKLVTVLFADLADSTALGEAIDPERLRSLLGTYFGAMAAVVEGWGGTVQKYVGDAIMATFGVPTVREDDAERALRSGLEMLDTLASLNVDFEARHGVRLGVRIGVNTGEVIVPVGGAMGDLIVAGDAVNTAARLQQAAPVGTVMVGPRTHDAARHVMRFGEPQALALKGKSAAVEAWPLSGANLESERGIPGLRAPMIGRERELGMLTDLLEEATNQASPRFAVVYGPAGMGKSRLVAEFATLARTADPPALVLRGRCLAIGHGITHWALGEILRSLAGVGLDEPAAVVERRLRETVEPLLSRLDLRPDEIERTIDGLALTAGIATDEADGRDGRPDRGAAGEDPGIAGAPAVPDPAQSADELALTWPRLASALALEQPLVLVIEDLHWAGEAVLELLTSLLARSTGPVMIMATARPEFAEAHPGFLAAREDAAQVTLRPLSAAQTETLVDRLLEIADLPAAVRTQILERAEGNPFFLEEILRRLIDEGAVVREGGRWRATERASEAKLPDSIHALLAARIDALGAAEKIVLQEASVVGRVFWIPPLARALPGEPIQDRLRGLEARGFTTARPTSTIAGAIEYQFRHSLVRDVAYGSLSRARRAAAHAAVAEWLEAFAGARREEFSELIAEHYRAAIAGDDADLAWGDLPDRREALRKAAIRALTEAGELANRRYALDRALELHEAALALADGPAEQAPLEEEIGDDQYSAFRAQQALEAYHRARELAPTGSGDRARLAMKLARTAAFRAGALQEQVPLADTDALILEGLAGNPEPLVRGWLLATSAAMNNHWEGEGHGDPVPISQRRAHAAEAAKIAEAVGAADLLNMALTAEAWIAKLSEAWADLIAISRRLLELAERSGDVGERMAILIRVSFVVSEVEGDTRGGYELAREAGRLDAGSRHARLHSTAASLWNGYLAGEWEAVAPLLDEHLTQAIIEGETTCGHVLLGIAAAGILAARRGDPDRGREAFARLETGLGRFGNTAGAPLDLLIALGERTRVRELGLGLLEEFKPPWTDALIAPMLDAAIELDDRALMTRLIGMARDRVAGMPALGPVGDRAEGLLRIQDGDAETGIALLRRAVAGFERFPLPFEVSRTHRHLASALVSSDPEESAELVEAAEAIERRLGLVRGGAATEPSRVPGGQ